MNKAFSIIGAAVLAVAAAFYLFLRSPQIPTHIHFMAPAGFVTGVIYYSEKRPEAAQHECDGRFKEMPDRVYSSELQAWEKRQLHPDRK